MGDGESCVAGGLGSDAGFARYEMMKIRWRSWSGYLLCHHAIRIMGAGIGIVQDVRVHGVFPWREVGRMMDVWILMGL